VEAIAVSQGRHSRNWPITQHRSVLAPLVFDPRTGVADNDARVRAGDAGEIEPHVRIRVASDHVLAFSEGDVPAVDDEPVAHAGGRWRPVYLNAERVSDAVRRPDNRRSGIAISQCTPNLLDQPGKCGIADKRPGPEALVQLSLGDDAGRLIDEEHEQIERFWREVHGSPIAAYLAPRNVDRTRAES
jgi:hypothetical protein